MQEVDKNIIEESKEKMKKIINEGGKVTNTIIKEKNKTTSIMKIEPVKGKATSSKILVTPSEIKINYQEV